MQKVAFGIPSYGTQPPDWWVPLVRQVGRLHEQGIEFVDVLQYGSMMTDRNRNIIARGFLASEAEWLFWVDSDNTNPVAALRRLLDTASNGKTLVSGIYFTKSSDEPIPVVYVDAGGGRYRQLVNWERGEIIPVDGAGMNCCLSHRSVYEDIDKNYVALRLATGGDIGIHRDDIKGDVFEGVSSDQDGMVIDGVYHQRLFAVEEPEEPPFFELRYLRTEDFGFFEKARRCGHILYVDTSVECGHLMTTQVSGATYRENTDGGRGREGDNRTTVAESGSPEPEWIVKA